MKYFYAWLWLLGGCLLTACSADIQDYQKNEPKFDLFEYFSSTTQAWGMVQDYTDKQTRRFEVLIKGSVEGEVLTLVEDFVFDDGEESQRIWIITRTDRGEYLGEADDIIGQAKGKAVGNTLHWQYTFLLQTEQQAIQVLFDDWMYRQDEKHMFNLTKIKKFGIEVGKITLFFQKQP
ncbi:DUF3833 domain-containing protein [Vibrio fujianensis]|uniref:DUF3833 domain-containing protein n=1 Tax=Vibrio fujianensis TaxID=1974215 RepID=UPI000C170A8D|nr:DUF3833 domain-containing protein [Vibrio fujianensis]